MSRREGVIAIIALFIGAMIGGVVNGPAVSGTLMILKDHETGCEYVARHNHFLYRMDRDGRQVCRR